MDLVQNRFQSTYCQRWRRVQLGDVIIRALHTPGHTMESTSYLLLDEARKPVAFVFSGDTIIYWRRRDRPRSGTKRI